MSSAILNNSAFGTARLRIKQPVYTSDKRAKFTQRENKKWIRFCTVIGYMFFVSLPAASLSIYYIWIWDPDYINRFPSDKNRTLTESAQILAMRQGGHKRPGSGSWKRISNIGIDIVSARTDSTNIISDRLSTTTPKPMMVQRPSKVTNLMLQQLISSNTAGQKATPKSNPL